MYKIMETGTQSEEISRKQVVHGGGVQLGAAICR